MPRPPSKYRNTVDAKSKKKKREENELGINKKKKRLLHDPYPWKEWFDKLDTLAKENPNKSVNIIITQGVDFTCQMHSMAVQVRKEASKFKRKVNVRIDGLEVVVTKRRGFGVQI